jgi:hypothetical protein
MKLFLFSLLLLAGCAGLKTLHYKEQPTKAIAHPHKAVVYFLRERNLGGVNYIIFDGKTALGVLSSSSYFYITVDAGKHHFSYSDSWSKELAPVEMILEKGKIYYLQMDQYLGGVYSTSSINNIPIYKGTFVIIEKNKAEDILKNLLEIDLEKNKELFEK